MLRREAEEGVFFGWKRGERGRGGGQGEGEGRGVKRVGRRHRGGE